MLKLVKRGWNYRTYMLVTKDSDFPAEELKERFANSNVMFERVNTLQDARKRLDEKLDAAWKLRKVNLEAEVKNFLSRYWDSISEAVVRNVEEKGVSLLLIYGYLEKDIPTSSYIRRILKTTPIEIQHIDVGVEDKVTREIPVTIGVGTKLSLEVEESPYLSQAFSERIGTEGRTSRQSPSFERQLRTIDIERQISIYAVVKRNESRALTEYELVDMRPDFRKALEAIDKERKSSS
jgi:hypothetical protein